MYWLRRSVSALGVIVVVSLLTFAILQWIPGDPAQIILGINASPDQLDNLRLQLGLNHPWYVQYGLWAKAALGGNFGVSRVYGVSVITLILQRMPVTLGLTGMALVLSLGLASWMGILGAVYQDRWFDRVSRAFMFTVLGIPSFWIGLVLILAFALDLHWLPVGGFPQAPSNWLAELRSLVLPAISLALVEAAVLGRIVRRSMIEALQSPFMITARSKGLPARRLILRHGLRTALIAPLTVLGLQVSSLLGGAVVVENLFALPGIGRLLLIAVEQKDYPLLEGITVFFALVVVVSSLLVDILYRRLDPRIDNRGGRAA